MDIKRIVSAVTTKKEATSDVELINATLRMGYTRIEPEAGNQIAL